MSRAWFPRRFPAVAVALAGLFVLSLGDATAADDPSSDPSAATIIGGDRNAQRCGQALSAGDLSDDSVSRCERALHYARLTRVAEVQIRTTLGIIRMRRGENLLAIEQFDAAIALDDDNAEIRLNRGAALVQMHEFGPAIAAITEAMSLGVREPHKAYFNRAAAREALGDLRGAYEDYSTALAIQPDWGPANAELVRFARARREQLAERLGEPASP